MEPYDHIAQCRVKTTCIFPCVTAVQCYSPDETSLHIAGRKKRIVVLYGMLKASVPGPVSGLYLPNDTRLTDGLESAGPPS